MFSSSESLYLSIKDILLKQKCSIRLLLRNPKVDDEHQKNKLNVYQKQWLDISDANVNCECKIRFCNNIDFRLIIIDNKDIYFGFYVFNGSKMIGKSVLMINITKGSALGNYLHFIARNKFDYYWDKNSSDSIQERRL